MRFHFRQFTPFIAFLVFCCAGVSNASVSGGPDKKCTACHATAAALQSSPTAHKPLREGRCQWCHKTHGSANANILHAGGGRDLCVICHKAQKPVEGEKENHGFSAKGECSVCHASHDSGRKNLLLKEPQELCLSCHEPIKNRLALAHPHAAAVDSCINCHNPHPSASEHLLKAKPTDLCSACHEIAPWQKPMRGWL
ncbi:MAG: hypothetical protein IPP78_00890 [Holophagaceae bacterium]|nr:hypothetical protein [Holophagaceae bacterium]